MFAFILRGIITVQLRLNKSLRTIEVDAGDLPDSMRIHPVIVCRKRFSMVIDLQYFTADQLIGIPSIIIAAGIRTAFTIPAILTGRIAAVAGRGEAACRSGGYTRRIRHRGCNRHIGRSRKRMEGTGYISSSSPIKREKGAAGFCASRFLYKQHCPFKPLRCITIIDFRKFHYPAVFKSP